MFTLPVATVVSHVTSLSIKCEKYRQSSYWIRQSSDLQDHSSYNFPPPPTAAAAAAAAAILPNSKHKQS